MLVKHLGAVHFTKTLSPTAWSNRVFLPGRDPGKIKITEFYAEQGESFSGVVYDIDETVRVNRGKMELTLADGKKEVIVANGWYYVPAGEVYSFWVMEKVQATCIFSQAEDGTLPQDEADPKLKEEK